MASNNQTWQQQGGCVVIYGQLEDVFSTPQSTMLDIQIKGYPFILSLHPLDNDVWKG